MKCSLWQLRQSCKGRGRNCMESLQSCYLTWWSALSEVFFIQWPLFLFPKTISEVQRNIFILTVVYFFYEDALSNPVIWLVLSAVLNVLSTYRGNARAIDKCVEKVSKYKIDFLGVGSYSGNSRSQFFSLLTFQPENNRYPVCFISTSFFFS